MAKKKWWFSENSDESVLFPNTVKQHKERLSSPVYVNGELVSESDYEDRDYYGWDKKPQRMDTIQVDDSDIEFDTDEEYDTKLRNKQKRAYLENASKNFDESWNKSWSNDSWKGYSSYREQTLSYRYVQQMANALASQHKIEVKVGREWLCDLKTRTLTYNPASLVYSSKSELLATLLHEIGKLRYSKSMDELKYNSQGGLLSTYLDKYGIIAYSTLMPFEELRIDTKMLGEYGSAGEIYESQEPSLHIVYDNYKKMSVQLKRNSVSASKNIFEGLIQDIMGGKNIQFDITMRARILISQGVDTNDAIQQAVRESTAGSQSDQITTRLRASFGVETEHEARLEMDRLNNRILAKDTIYDYIASMYSTGYILKRDKDFSVEMKTRITQTAPSFGTIVKCPDAVDVLGIMDSSVYPVVEDLLDEAKNGFTEHGQFGQGFADAVNQLAKSKGMGDQEVDSNGNQKVRSNQKSDPTQDTTVPEWFNGDYKVLKDSVKSEINRLSRMLTFLKRTEQQVKWVGNQRRGKLNMKKLYRAKMGNRRVFKQRIDSIDTVRSFAFSIVIDISGSMAGSRIANTTRGMIILAEVFKDMSIPFEIITFDSDAKVIKSFDGTFDKDVEKTIGGLPNYDGGGTNLDKGLKLMKLKERTERNKVCIVLTDGGVGSSSSYNEKYFNPMLQKDHIKSLAFGLEISQKEIGELCNGTGRAIENAVEVPYIFSDLLKSLIMKKQK